MEDNQDKGREEEGEVGQPSRQSGSTESEEKQSVQSYIAIKGTRNGLLLTLEPDTPFHELLNALAERLAEAPTFFRGACLSLDTSRRTLRASEQLQLETLLAHYQMSVAPLTETRRPASTITLPPFNASTAVNDGVALQEEVLKENASRDPRDSDDTLFLRRTIRSGQAVRHSSNIVILGDVNPGAEIIAGGDVIVWGVLRGMVHAGYPDNLRAIVCSLLLSPVQLRIAHLLSRPPEGFEAQPRPEVASIKNGQIVVEAWINGRASRR